MELHDLASPTHLILHLSTLFLNEPLILMNALAALARIRSDTRPSVRRFALTICRQIAHVPPTCARDKGVLGNQSRLVAKWRVCALHASRNPGPLLRRQAGFELTVGELAGQPPPAIWDSRSGGVDFKW